MPDATQSSPSTFQTMAGRAWRGARVVGRHGRAAVRELRHHEVSTSQGTAQEHSPPETRADKARRRGYIYHGEFKYKIAYDPDIITDRVIDTIANGAYERFEGRRSVGLVEDGDRIVELGAGLGFLSTLLLDRKKIADYQAVEADPRLVDMIRRTHELNGVHGPLTIRSCVATNDDDLIKAGTAEFFVGEKFCGSSLLGTYSPLKHTVQVPVISLMDLVREHGSNVLIADIEGAEADIINGTPLDGIEKILMETHPARLGLEGIGLLFRNLDAQGFVYDGAHSSGNVCGFRRLDTVG